MMRLAVELFLGVKKDTKKMKLRKIHYILGCILAPWTFICGYCWTVINDPATLEVRAMKASDLFSGRKLKLVVAAEKGDVGTIESLVRDGVDVNSVGRYGVTPLMRCVLAESKSGYSALLRLGANPNAFDREGFSVVEMSAEQEDSFYLQKALEHGGDPNYENKISPYYPGRTVIHTAIWSDKPKNLKILIDAGAHVNHPTKKGSRPLGAATTRGYEMVLMLLEAGAEYRYNGYDLVEEMNVSIKNGRIRDDDISNVWFFKTVDFLKRKGEKFIDVDEKKLEQK